MHYRSIRLFAVLFTLSLGVSAVLAMVVTGQLTFAFHLPPEAAASLEERIAIIRAAGLGLAAVLMLLVSFAASRAARGALMARWFLGVATSIGFLRGAGLVQTLPVHDGLLITASVLQIALEGFAILLLYGEDASEWFVLRR